MAKEERPLYVEQNFPKFGELAEPELVELSGERWGVMWGTEQSMWVRVKSLESWMALQYYLHLARAKDEEGKDPDVWSDEWEKVTRFASFFSEEGISMVSLFQYCYDCARTYDQKARYADRDKWRGFAFEIQTAYLS